MSSQEVDDNVTIQKDHNVSLEIVRATAETCNQALEVFAEYNLSQGLGLIDALIGQTAISLGVPLHTFNVKHYAVIPNLITVQPYKRL
ncbi:MAG: PIN domain-containing protein [Pseudanabaena sp.]